MAVERKYERDIDVLLAEEFAVSPAFATWFLKQTRFSQADARVLDVYVSRSDSNGETDLTVVFEEVGGNRRFALLIEDKVDAPLQPDQEARYHIRGRRESARGDYDEFDVILCSPKAYRIAQTKAASFNRFVSYEAISDFLRHNHPSERGCYRAQFIAAATSRSMNTWQKVDDATTTAFWDAAYDIASREFHALEMKPLNLTKDLTWINFRPQDMPTLPKRIYISFKGDRGFMDLTFSDSLAHELIHLVRPLLDPDMTVHQTGKSAAIRIAVDGFKVSESPATAMPKVRAAFIACERLINFYRDHRGEIERGSL